MLIIKSLLIITSFISFILLILPAFMNDINNLHILIVEDDPITQFLTQQILNAEGIKHSTVSNGEKAIDALKTKKFNCVLMDIVMPGEDGINTVRWIRDSEDDYFKKLPIFALTSFSTKEHTAEIMEAGLNGHLVKPLDVDSLKKLYQQFAS